LWSITVTLPRRKFLHLAAGAAALPAVTRIAGAQTYPTRPVHIIVGYAPGGANDISARLMGQWLSEQLGRQFVIENRPGAGSNLATETVVHAPPDGYTLLLVNTSNAINPALAIHLQELWLSSARDRPVACRARHVGRNPPGVRSAWLYKQQSRRPMSENRRLCLSPNARLRTVQLRRASSGTKKAYNFRPL
jgi:hypothetical protein